MPPEAALRHKEFPIVSAKPEEIFPLRALHRREMNCQIVHDSFPARGFSDSYAIQIDGKSVGYGLVAKVHFPGTVTEFYLEPPYRQGSLPMFHQMLEVSSASHIRAQTNDRELLMLLYDCAVNIVPLNVLFADGLQTELVNPGGTLRKKLDTNTEDWIIEVERETVATGGILFHYNPPFGDIFMEVDESLRQRGFGSYLVQELKRICYKLGKVPAARCDISNAISRKTLEKAGMLPCGRILQGEVHRQAWS